MTSAVITLYRDLPDEDVDRLLALLDEARIDAEVGPPDIRMGTLLEATTQMLAQASLEGLSGVLMTAAGVRLWKGLRGLFDRDSEEGNDDRHEVVAVIIDPQTGNQLELTRAALRQYSLSELSDLISLVNERSDERAPLVIIWDEAAQTWCIRR
ncbi:hypothetical protein ACN3XK_72290 [Actinomadura welshii]